MTDLAQTYLETRRVATEDQQQARLLDEAIRTDKRNSEMNARTRERVQIVHDAVTQADEALGQTGEALGQIAGPEGTPDQHAAYRALASSVTSNLLENVLTGGVAAGANLLETYDQVVTRMPLSPIPGLQKEVVQEAHQAFVGWRERLRTDDTVPDRIVQEFAQFTIPFTAGLRALGVTKTASTAKKIAAGMTAEAGVSFAAMDDDAGRFIDMLDLIDPGRETSQAWIEWLQTDEDEGEIEARFKNMVDSSLVAGAGTALYQAGKIMRQILRNPERVASRQAEEMIEAGK